MPPREVARSHTGKSRSDVEDIDDHIQRNADDVGPAPRIKDDEAAAYQFCTELHQNKDVSDAAFDAVEKRARVLRQLQRGRERILEDVVEQHPANGGRYQPVGLAFDDLDLGLVLIDGNFAGNASYFDEAAEKVVAAPPKA